MIRLQEHELLKTPDGTAVKYDERYDKLELIQRCKPPIDKAPWGYYASYKIGAEWIDIDNKKALIVTPKKGVENIDFLSMFMACFNSDLALDSFAEIYKINTDKPQISAPTLSSVISPLIVIHFISVVNRIKSLKRAYVSHQENLKKVKGRIKLLKNERQNIAMKRYDRIFCEYDEYSIDIPENRLIKKALLFSKVLLSRMSHKQETYSRIKLLLMKALKKFENVSDEVDVRSVRQIRSHKLFSEYSEAIRLAKLILRHFDYSINKASIENARVTPFVLDMSLLYEHYVYGLLHEAYHDKIEYHYGGKTGYPDFLYKSEGFKAILDTKYIPKYEKEALDIYVIRQLCGYSRDLRILRCLGYDGINEKSDPAPIVPGIIIYPKEGDKDNPFKDKTLKELCEDSRLEKSLLCFYKLSVPVPSLTPK